VDFALFRILALVASEIRHRDQKSNYIDVMSFRVKLAGCSAFIIQCSVAAIFIIAWKSEYYGLVIIDPRWYQNLKYSQCNRAYDHNCLSLDKKVEVHLSLLLRDRNCITWCATQ